jgi:probable rRNA maturation factor
MSWWPVLYAPMTPKIDIELSIECDGWPQYAAGLVDHTLNAALAGLPDPGAGPLEVSVLLTGDQRQKKLNARWRGIKKATNVLSFPASTPPAIPGQPVPSGHLGDISLALETLLGEAKEQKKSFKEHLCHLLVHGFLHLAGYDHANDLEADQMERLEIDILSGLAIANPYANIEDCSPLSKGK